MAATTTGRCTAAIRVRRWWRWCGIIALAGYGLFLYQNMAIVAGGSDSSGYLNSARLLAKGELMTELRAPKEFGPRETLPLMHMVPHGFFRYPDGQRLIPTYPTGLPLHYAFSSWFVGWRVGPVMVALFSALASVALLYATIREVGLRIWSAVAGAVTLAAFPVFIFTSIQALSDTVATTWTLLAIFAALRARHQTGWAAVCGFALAVAVLVRPTNLVVVPGLLVILGLNPRKLGIFILSGLPGALWLAFYNWTLYGSPFRSGYGHDLWEAFAFSYFTPTAVHFATWLSKLAPTALLLLPFVALLHKETRRRELVAMLLIFSAITGVYLLYEISREVWWCLRFILPALPTLVVAALLGLEAIARGPGAKWSSCRPVLATAVTLWAIGASWYWTPRLHVLLTKDYERGYATGSLAARQQLPRDALVVSFAFSGALYFYSDFPILRWDQIQPADFARYAALAREAGRPVCAVLFEFEERDAMNRCPGNWRPLSRVGNVGLWQLAPPSS